MRPCDALVVLRAHTLAVRPALDAGCQDVLYVSRQLIPKLHGGGEGLCVTRCDANSNSSCLLCKCKLSPAKAQNYNQLKAPIIALTAVSNSQHNGDQRQQNKNCDATKYTWKLRPRRHTSVSGSARVHNVTPCTSTWHWIFN